jgi:TusA-related sulfurtransferase
METTPTVDKEIDTRGLNCPLPILRAKKALSDMTSGQVLKILATDPGSVRDFQAFAKQTGNELLAQQTVDGIHSLPEAPMSSPLQHRVLVLLHPPARRGPS